MRNDPQKQFDVLVVPHLERLFRVAHRLMGNTSDARDLVQDTCVVACENLTELGIKPQPLHWLLRVQRNLFIDGARRRKRAPMVAMDLHARAARVASAEPGPEEVLEQTDSERALERAFQQLDDNQRLLLTLRAEGYELEEIEAILGIESGALRARLLRARRSLAQRLDEESDRSGCDTRAWRNS
jgi:RNA polymerase sigma factor (sigma-70 family)